MYTYIIIDDEELIRKGTIKKLEILKDQVNCIGEASEGKEGIQLISSLKPDFTILDMQMPGMNGQELLPYLSKNFPDMPLIVISGYKNFDYIKQAISSNAIEYVLKPFNKETIKEVVLKAIAKLEDRYQIDNRLQLTEQEKEQAHYEYDYQLLNNWLLGYEQQDNQLCSQRLKYIADNHQICVFLLHGKEETSIEKIPLILPELKFGDMLLFFKNPSNASVATLVLFSPKQLSMPSERYLKQFIELVFSLFQQHDILINIGISNFHNNVLKLNDAYNESISALNQQCISPKFYHCHFYTDNPQLHAFVWEKEEELLFRMESGMCDEVNRLTDELFDFYSTHSHLYNLMDLKYYVYALTNQCQQILNEYLNISDTVKTSNSIHNAIILIFSIDELKNYCKQFFINLTNMIRPKSVYAIDDTIEKIKIYLQRNYYKDLSQELVASLFYMNRSYLSTLFREKTKEKFVDYLNYIRIEHSISLLIETDKKMYQIAKTVGYDNVKYFFRVFKKIKKMTPEEYRLTFKKMS